MHSKSFAFLVSSAHSSFPSATLFQHAHKQRIGLTRAQRAQLLTPLINVEGSGSASHPLQLASYTCLCLQQVQAQQQAAAGLRQPGAPVPVPNSVGRPPAAGLPAAPARMAELQPARKVMKKRKLAPVQPALPVERVRCPLQTARGVLLRLAWRLAVQQQLETNFEGQADTPQPAALFKQACRPRTTLCASPLHGRQVYFRAEQWSVNLPFHTNMHCTSRRWVFVPAAGASAAGVCGVCGEPGVCGAAGGRAAL